MTAMDDLPTDFDLIVVGTGFPECIIAAAAARVGKKVLHIDKNDYYGGQWTSFTLSGMHQWLQDLQQYLEQQDQIDTGIGDIVHKELLQDNETFVPTADPRQVYTNVKQCWHVQNTSKKEKNEGGVQSQDNVDDEVEKVTQNLSTKEMEVQDENPEVAIQTTPSTSKTEALNVNPVETMQTTSSKSDSEVHDMNPEDSMQTKPSTIEMEVHDMSSEETRTSTVESIHKNELKASGDSDVLASAENIESSILWTQDQMMDQSRRFNLDLAPKLLYSCGPLVDLLVSSNVARYVEFKCISRVITWKSSGDNENEGGLIPVPCSRSDVFTATNVTLIEKRLLMKLLEFCHSYQGHEEVWKDHASKPFIDFLKHRKLTPNLIHFVIEALAMVPQNITTEEGLKKTQLFLSSLGRYGTTPFLFSMYGCGELPQAFCRLCAVFEGTYILRRGLTGVIVDSNQSCVGIVTEGQRFKCSNLVMDGAYWNPQHLTSSKPKNSQQNNISRGIFIVDRSLLAADKEQLTLLRIPAKDGNPKPVMVLEVGYGAGVTPKDLYCVQLTCAGSNAETDFQITVERLFATQNDSVNCIKPKILWSLYFNQLDVSSSDVCGVTPENIFLCSGPDALLDYDAPITQARNIFKSMYPDEEFLPRAPDPEDIVFDNDGVQPKQDDNFASQEESTGDGSPVIEKEVDNIEPMEKEISEKLPN